MAKNRIRAVSEWIYRRGLHAYPAAYRARFGHEMYDAFRELNAEHAAIHARRIPLRLWAREARGLATNALRERAGTLFRKRTEWPDTLSAHSTALGALIMFAVILTGYVLTLAPTVTFWDAGEYLAASKTLGIPHQPGTPVWVFVSSVWASVFPFGEYAFRLNLMTAVFSAAAAALLFSVVAKILLANGGGRRFALVAAASAAIVSAFTFTMWQNSNETEVYAIAVFAIAASVWLVVRWRETRGTPKAARLLLATIYISALSVGNHLLALLVGPALIVFVFHVIRTAPLADPLGRRSEWTQLGVLSASWVLLVGIGLGSSTIFTLATLTFAAVVLVATLRGEARFSVSAAAICIVGVSSYLFLYIRAGLAPAINMSDPSNWEALLGVIRREQYPVRLPTDNPLFATGEGNPGRTLGLLWLQVANYLQYFDWQWAAGLDKTRTLLAPSRLPFTLGFLSLGYYGLSHLRQRDRSAFWLLVLIFVVTGPVLVAYMNFRPGFSIGLDRYPSFTDHEVRERDYFFLVSFQMWGAFAGIGIARLYAVLRKTLTVRYDSLRLTPHLAIPILGIALLPFALNFKVASRSYGPEAQLARDFAYDMLQTIEPYGVLVTNGDNDTYPLWYLQNVEGIRRDVTVIVRTLANMDWYMRDLRDRPVHPFLPEQAPWFADIAPLVPPPPLHSLSNDEIASASQGIFLRDGLRFQAGVIDKMYPPETVLYPTDVITLRMIQENVGKRSVYFAMSAGSDVWMRLEDSLVMEGLAYKLYADRRPDPSHLADSGFGTPGFRMPINLARTEWLARDVFRYAGLTAANTMELDATNRQTTAYFSRLHLSLAVGHDSLGHHTEMIENLVLAYQFSPTEDLRRMVDSLAPGALDSFSIETEDDR